MSGAPVPYRVVRRQKETVDTVTIELEPVDRTLPPFAPGQFAMVYAFGAGEIPVSVSEISGHRLTHTVRDVGAVSGALCRLRPGAQAGLRGPFGTGWELPESAGRDLLVIAGGIGLAPLRPLVLAALAEPPAFGHLNVLVGARTPGDILYRAQLRRWAEAYTERAHTAVTVDRPDAHWCGHVGVVTTLLGRARFHPPDTTAFICGPEVMIRAIARELLHLGLPAHRIRVSLERNMRCATGHCGHCQLGPVLLCRDGPVIEWGRAEPLLGVREL